VKAGEAVVRTESSNLPIGAKLTSANVLGIGDLPLAVDDRSPDSAAPWQEDSSGNAYLPRIESLEAEIQALKELVADQGPPIDEGDDSTDGIKLGGAVRFQYSVEDYNAGNRDRGGDIDFDIFRLDLDGELGGVLLSAQYRWFQYMDVIHHAWVGYPFNDHWQTEVGITRVPFGNHPYNSHNFFFSSVFYVGLEDDHDAGLKLCGQGDNHDLRLAFFVTDEMGGIDGFVDNRTDRYAYDLVGIRAPGEGIFAPPATEIAEHNSLSVRYVYKFPLADVGGSILYGDLRDRVGSVGNRLAYALHLNSTIDRWNVQLQFTDYDYDAGASTGLLVVGAYSFYDTIPASARIYSFNVAYSLPVQIGPITNLQFYNDHSITTDKSGGLTQNSVMNVAGVAVTAGGLYTYFDIVSAKNHPFVGGSMGANDDDWNTRFNVNVGFYF
jgi:hypothetical protein